MTPLDLRLSRLAGRAALAALAGAALAAELAPVGAAAGPAAAPDFLFCLVAALAARRPQLAPPPLVFVLGLLRDLLSGGPIGLGALALMLSVEALRAREPAIRRRGAALEWPLAAALCGLALGGQAAALWATAAPAPDLEALAARYGLTLMAYPPVALALAWPLGRLATREAER